MKDGGIGSVIEEALYIHEGDAISAEVKKYYTFGD
jgi:hypothetical protein